MANFRWQVSGCGCDCKEFCETDALSKLPCVIGRGLNKSDVISAINAWGNKYSNLSAYVLYPSCNEDVLGCVVAINNSSDVVYQNIINTRVPVSDQNAGIQTIKVTKNTVSEQLDSIAPINPSGYIVYLCSSGYRRYAPGILPFSCANPIDGADDNRVSVQFVNIDCTKVIKENLDAGDVFWTNPCKVAFDFNISSETAFSFKSVSPSFCYTYTQNGSRWYEYSKVSYYVFTSPNSGFAELYPPGVSRGGLICKYTSPSSRLEVSVRATVNTVIMKPLKVGYIFYIEEPDARRYFYAKTGVGSSTRYYKLWISTLTDYGFDAEDIVDSCTIDSSDISEIPSYTNGSLSIQSVVNAAYSGLSPQKFTVAVASLYIGSQAQFDEYSANNPVGTVYTYETYDAFVTEVMSDVKSIIRETDAKSFVSIGMRGNYSLPCSILYAVETKTGGATPITYPECMEK